MSAHQFNMILTAMAAVMAGEMGKDKFAVIFGLTIEQAYVEYGDFLLN